MRGISDEQNPTPHELPSDDTVQRPVADREDLGGYGGVADGCANPSDATLRAEAFEGRRRAVVGDLAKPSPARVERLKDAAQVSARNPKEERGTVGDPRVEVGTEIDVDEVAETPQPVESDAELLADPTGGAVCCKQIFRVHAIVASARTVFDVDD